MGKVLKLPTKVDAEILAAHKLNMEFKVIIEKAAAAGVREKLLVALIADRLGHLCKVLNDPQLIGLAQRKMAERYEK